MKKEQELTFIKNNEGYKVYSRCYDGFGVTYKKIGKIFYSSPDDKYFFRFRLFIITFGQEVLEQLSQKAGLKKDAWKNSKIYVYEVEKFSEWFLDRFKFFSRATNNPTISPPVPEPKSKILILVFSIPW